MVIIGPRGLQCETNLQEIIWCRNLLMWSDLTLDSSFKVKQWMIGFGKLCSGGYNLHWFFGALGLVYLGFS